MKEFVKKLYDEVLEINAGIYPLESVQLAANALLDDGFFYIYSDEKGKKPSPLKIAIKARNEDIDSLKGDFLKELNRQSLRIQLAKINRKVRTQVIGRALSSSIPVEEEKKEQ